jgi:hypothetical protein
MDQETIEEWTKSEDVIRCIIGEEKRRQSGYHQFQGYVEFNTVKSIWQVKKMISDETHWEMSQGSREDNKIYCEKEGKIRWKKHMGTNNMEKKKKQDEYWTQVLNDARELNAEEFQAKWPKEWLIRRSAIERIMTETREAKVEEWAGDLKRKNVWIWGVAGIGKSRWAQRQAPGIPTYKEKHQ